MKACTISGLILTPAGEGMEGRLVRARVLEAVLDATGTVSGAPLTAKTDTEGAFEIDLPQGATCRIEIPETGLDSVFVVPARGAVDLSALDLRPTPDPLGPSFLAEALGGFPLRTL